MKRLKTQEQDPRPEPMKSKSYHDEARALIARARPIDGHADTLGLVLDDGLSFLDPGPSHLDHPRLVALGMGTQVLTCWNEPEHTGFAAFARAMAKIGAYHRLARRGALRSVRTPADLEGPGVGYVLSLEDGAPVMGSEVHLEALYAAGVRMIGLTWNGRNELADGVLAAERPSGLTRVGLRILEAMEALGIVVDCSHLAEPGFWDVAEHATKPFVCSHSNAKAQCDHPRNLTDAQLGALAEAGGMTGLCFAPQFLKAGGEAGLEDAVRHVDHIVSKFGPHVLGLGSDWDGIASTPEGLSGAGDLVALVAELLARGYDEPALTALLSGNWKRVFSACWRA